MCNEAVPEDKRHSYLVMRHLENNHLTCACQCFEFGGIICTYTAINKFEKYFQNTSVVYFFLRWTKDTNKVHGEEYVFQNIDVDLNLD